MPLSSAEAEVVAWWERQLRERLSGRIVRPEEVRKAVLEIWELAKVEFELDPDPEHF